MSNLVPNASDDDSLIPKGENRTGSFLEGFIIQQEASLSRTTDLEEVKQKIEILEKAIEVSKKLNALEVEKATSAIELESKRYAQNLSIEETNYKILSVRAKTFLGIASIPASIGIGLYAYIFLNQPYLGVMMVIFGLGGATLTFSKEEIMSLILPRLNSKENK